MNINWLDIIIGVLLIWSYFRGHKKGLTEEVFQFLRVIAVVFFSMKYTIPFAHYLKEYLNFPLLIVRIIAFAGIVFGALMLLYAIKVILQKVVDDIPVIDGMEKVGGGIFALVKTCLIIGIIIMILSFLPFYTLQKELKQKTVIASYIIEATPKVFDFITSYWQSPIVVKISKFLKKNKSCKKL